MPGRGGDPVSKLQAELLRLRAANPFQVLAIPPFADADVVRAAYLTAAKRFHPTLFALRGPDAREVSNEIFLLIRRAYAELTDDERRKAWRERVASATTAAAVAAAAPKTPPAPAKPTPTPPPKPEPPRRPPTATRAAGTPPGKRNVTEILEEVRTRPQRIEEALSHLKKGRFRQAREALHAIAAEDPRNMRVRAYLHFAWGLEHRESGAVDEAARELERALAIEPGLVEADKALREIRDKGKKGLLSKLFGRE